MIYVVVEENGRSLKTSILTAFTRYDKAKVYMDKLAKRDDLIYSEECDEWRDDEDINDYTTFYHIEPIQLEES